MIRVTDNLYRLLAKLCSAAHLSNTNPIDGLVSESVEHANILDDLDNSMKTSNFLDDLDSLTNTDCCNKKSPRINACSLNVNFVPNNIYSFLDGNSRIILKSLCRKDRKKFSPEKKYLLESEGELIHARLGHISPSYLYKLRTVATDLKDFIFNKLIEKCLSCAQAKMIRKSYREDARCAKLFVLT